jgi:Cu-Zn family superoxide dismutase
MSCNNAIAIFDNPSVKGSVKFHQCLGSKETKVIFDLHGLAPDKQHAIHIHEYGDESKGCKSLGGHWNPYNKQHGSIFINICDSHAGDLINNIVSDNKGEFYYIYIDPRIQLNGNVKESILGRSVVIHHGVDDLGQGNNPESKITGNAGGRMVCAIIGHAKNERQFLNR